MKYFQRIKVGDQLPQGISYCFCGRESIDEDFHLGWGISIYLRVKGITLGLIHYKEETK